MTLLRGEMQSSDVMSAADVRSRGDVTVCVEEQLDHLLVSVLTGQTQRRRAARAQCVDVTAGLDEKRRRRQVPVPAADVESRPIVLKGNPSYGTGDVILRINHNK